MNPKRIVIIGGPSSGKTTLISHLETEGFAVMHEISREVIKEAQQQGIEQLFLENPLLFSQKLMEGRIKQFEEAENHNTPFLFYDRGMPDVIAYLNYLNIHFPINFAQVCSEKKYDAIFLLPPWQEIYISDNERYETFEQATAIHDFLLSSYESHGYTVHEIPLGSLTERTKFIVEKLSLLF